MNEDIVEAKETIPMKQKVGGVLFLAAGAATVYFTAYKPLIDSQRTGELTYYYKAVLGGPLLIYLGILLFAMNLQGGTTRTINAKGKPTFTRKGWGVFAGALLVIALTTAVWWYLLKVFGFPMF